MGAGAISGAGMLAACDRKDKAGSDKKVKVMTTDGKLVEISESEISEVSHVISKILIRNM